MTFLKVHGASSEVVLTSLSRFCNVIIYARSLDTVADCSVVSYPDHACCNTMPTLCQAIQSDVQGRERLMSVAAVHTVRAWDVSHSEGYGRDLTAAE
jgi:hypothetical protein